MSDNATITLEWTKANNADGVVVHTATSGDATYEIEDKGGKKFALYFEGRAVKLGSLKVCRDEAERLANLAPESDPGDPSDEELESSGSEDTAPEEPPVKVEKLDVAATSSKPGVVNTILKMLQGATESNPVTKVEILAALKKEFPDREGDKMKSTINTQMHSTQKLRTKYQILKNEKGYWIPSPDAPKPKNVGKKKKGKKSAEAAS